MKFILVILSLLAVMVAANNEVTENAELMSARCKGVAKRFVRGWYKVDTNRNGKVTWPEMARFYVKWARSHGKSNAWIKAHGRESTDTGKSGLVPRTTSTGNKSGTSS